MEPESTTQGSNLAKDSEKEFIISPHERGDNFAKEAFVKDGKIFYSNAGSSSCPPIVESVYQNGSTINLYVKNYKGRICTMDLVGIVQIIEYKDGTPVSDEMTLKII